MFNEVQNEKIKTVAENFCNTYFDCWKNAVNSEEGITKYKGIKDTKTSDGKPTGALKVWTDFHMKEILYKLAETLTFEKNDKPEVYKKGEKCEDITIHCHKCSCKTKCGYGESWQKEYYKVDFLLSNYNGVGNWCNDFYIEHENAHFRLYNNDANKVQQNGWFSEFNKLLPLNTSDDGMRVIISYDDFDMIKEKKTFLENHLNDSNSLTQKSMVKKPILVILAPSIKAIKGGEDNWCFHIMLFTFDKEWKCDYEKYSDEDKKIKGIFEQIKNCQ